MTGGGAAFRVDVEEGFSSGESTDQRNPADRERTKRAPRPWGPAPVLSFPLRRSAAR